MATCIHNPQKGDFVYEAFCPAKAGIVLEYYPPPQGLTLGTLKVKLINGDIVTKPEQCFNNFIGLIEDHRKKLAHHLVTLEKLQKMLDPT